MRARVCVCVCVCTYYGYPSEIHVDEVIYETIDPDRNSSEGLCANSFVLFPVITIILQVEQLWYPAMQPPTE